MAKECSIKVSPEIIEMLAFDEELRKWFEETCSKTILKKWVKELDKLFLGDIDVYN